MPSIEAPQWTQAFVNNGDTTGYIDVVNSDGFFVGAYAYLVATGLGERCVITELVSSTRIGVRIVPDEDQTSSGFAGPKSGPFGGRSDLSAYTVVGNAKISQPSQVVRVEMAWQRPTSMGV